MTSGREPLGERDALAPVLGLADDLDVVEQLEEAAQPAPDDRVVVDEEHADRSLLLGHGVAPLGGRFMAARSMHERVDSFRLRQITQPLGAQVAQDRAGGQPPAELLDRRPRNERLPAVGEPKDPRGPKQGPPVEAVALQLDLAARHRQASAEAADLAPVLVTQRSLDLVGRRNRRHGVVEGRVRGVPDALEDAAAVARGAFGDQRVVAGERDARRVPMQLSDAGAALDVGEQEAQVPGSGCGRLHTANGRRQCRAASRGGMT